MPASIAFLAINNEEIKTIGFTSCKAEQPVKDYLEIFLEVKTVATRTKTLQLFMKWSAACRHCRHRKDLKIYRGKARVAVQFQ